jgi:translation initiation factor 2 beta subunit (eIF-2beta)/eIF-5
MNTPDRINYSACFIAILCCALVGLLSYNAGQATSTILSNMGNVASFFGFLIVMVQLQYVKRVSEETKHAVEDTQKSLMSAISIADISKTIKLIEQVQIYVGQDKYELAWVRLKDVRFYFTQLSSHPEFSKENTSSGEKTSQSIGVHLNNLHTAYSQSKKFDPSKLNITLEKMLNVLLKVEHNLKFPKGNP